jgi:hypothetical protein
MWKRQRALVAAAALLLAVTLPGCTDEQAGEPAAAPSPAATPKGGAPELRERPAAFDVGYRKVAGDIRKSGRAQVLRAVSRPVRAWIDNGFVAGPWPRTAFGQAYAPFGRGIIGRARRDADLLTLRAMGGSLEAVVPLHRWIRVSVTGVRGHVVGATARVDLRVLGTASDGRRSRVTVRGDLYLTRVPGHGWKIFGYRLDRWVDEGAMARGGA